MPFDLTDIGANRAQNMPPVRSMNPVSSHDDSDDPEEDFPDEPVEKMKLSDSSIAIGDHVVKVRGSITKKELEKRAWTPDKFVQDGQIFAGEEDEAHKQFLKETTWVK